MAFAQAMDYDDELVRWTPQGSLIFVNEGAVSEDIPLDGVVQAVVYRRIGDNDSFEEITRLERADSWDEFVERAGMELIQQLSEGLRITEQEELWSYIREHPLIDHYDINLALDRRMWKAFGTAYTDNESAELRPGQEVTYRVRHVMEDGSPPDTLYHGTVVVGEKPVIESPILVDRLERKNEVGAIWSSPLEGSHDAIFAHVYRQHESGSEFEKIPGQIFANRIDDRIVYRWRESIEPGRALRYYIRPLDIAGVPGPPSDTTTVISADFDNLPLLGNVSATDTTDGIYLSWHEIDERPYITGIEIRRSRDARSGYRILDTLSVSATEYFDYQALPNTMYYYQFRVVTVREATELPSGVASASYRNKNTPPSTPAGLTAEHEEEGVRLTWDSVHEPDLFGYYVYRGTSRHDSLAVVSRAIRDTTTFLDNSEELDGRTNYVYAVQAVNVSDLRSELSDKIVIRPNRLVQPPAPPGVQGYGELNRIRLSWSGVQRQDPAVAGYHLYRSSEPVANYRESMKGAEMAKAAGLERINEEMLNSTHFDDLAVESGAIYYYAVTSVDRFGVESQLSSVSRFRTASKVILPPSQFSARQTSFGVELRWNETQQQDIREYRIYRRARGEESPTLLSDLPASTTRYTDDTAVNGTVYWYSIQVSGESGESRRSTERSVHFQ
ncbi:MAG: hypothetical protein EA391_02290 [Balneolaceae bacterium]|nr:MAG: hypothetical protein EA391_02290 [Balneolaceae bacterium]